MARVFSNVFRFFGPDGEDLDSFGNPLFPKLRVEELDGEPSAHPVDTLIFDQNAGFTVIDNEDGSVTVSLVDDGEGEGGEGAPFECADLANCETSQLPYTPTTPSDWNPAPDDAGEALDQIADRLTTIEDECCGPGGGEGGALLTVKESDNTPTVFPVDTLIFDSAGFRVTDNADGSVAVENLCCDGEGGGGGGGGDAFHPFLLMGA